VREGLQTAMRQNADRARTRLPADLRRPSSRRAAPAGGRDATTKALGLASPHIVTAGLAGVLSVVSTPNLLAGVPLSLTLIVVVQVLGVLLGREVEQPRWSQVWMLVLVTTVLLLPWLALQGAASRLPFVAWARDSAGTLLWTTAGAIVALSVVVTVTAGVSARQPEQASLLFLPAALLVPAIMGAPGQLDERSTLTTLAEVFAVASVIAFAGWLLPLGARPLVAPAGLALQFVVLWLLGYGPAFAQGRGGVVPAMASLVLIVTVAAAVLVPLAALTARRMLWSMGDSRRPS